MTTMGLYLITNERDCPCTNSLLIKCEQALQGGVKWLQYRVKKAPHPDIIAEATALKQLCDDFNGVKFFINDHLELAKHLGTGLHIGQNDTDLCSAKKIIGDTALIGVTCHNQLTLAQAAISQGANYVSFGAIFNSQTKPNAKPAPLSLLGEAKNRFSVPIVAIGGITEQTAHRVYAAGADIIALSHGILGASDITHTCQTILNGKPLNEKPLNKKPLQTP